MITRSSLRDKFGEGYVTYLDDNTVIPWKPLGIGDYFKYDSMLREGEIVIALLEDEIFKKCVLNKAIINSIDTMPYGTVSIVVQNIMEHSGPLSIDHFNNALDIERNKVKEPIHYLVALIIRAFPGYLPEQVYDMPWDVFVFRLAQAESFLLQMGVIQEPVALVDPNEKPKKRRGPKQVPGELKAAWDQQHKKPEVPKQVPTPPEKTDNFFKPVDMTPESSPILKNGKINVIRELDTDRVKIEQAVGSEEENQERARLVKEAQLLYKPLMDKLDFYKQK